MSRLPPTLNSDPSPGGEIGTIPLPPSNFRRLVRDLPAYAVGNGSLALAGFAGVALFTRWLSPSEYGVYTLTLTTATVSESVLFSWVNNATLRYLPGYDRDEGGQIFLATSFIVTAALLLGISVIWIVATLLVGERTPAVASAVRAGITVLAARVLFGFAVGVVRARRQAARYAVYTAASAGGIVLLSLALRGLVGDIGPDGLLYMVSLAGGIPAAVELFRSKSFGWLRPHLFRGELARHCARYGLPLAGAALGASVLSVADRYLIQCFGTARDVGTYSAGYDLTDKFLKLVFTVLVAAALPVVMTVVYEQGLDEASRLIGRTLRLYVVWMVPLTVTVIAFRRTLVEAVLGPDFGGAVAVVPWVAVGTLCWGASQILAQIFQVQERTGPLLYWLLAAAAISVGLNLWLIPTTGLTGAALATTGTYAFYLAALWLACVRSPALAVTARDGGVALAAGAVMLAVMTLVPFALAKVSLGLAAYGVSVRLLRATLFDEVARDVRAALAFARTRVQPRPGGHQHSGDGPG